MAKIVCPDCRNTNSKDPRNQFLTKYVKSKSPKSSLDVREVRQAQVIDADYKDKDLEFDTNNIIEYDEEDTNVLDELCDHNQKKVKEIEDSIQVEGSDSPPPAISDPFHHNCTD